MTTDSWTSAAQRNQAQYKEESWAKSSVTNYGPRAKLPTTCFCMAHGEKKKKQAIQFHGLKK